MKEKNPPFRLLFIGSVAVSGAERYFEVLEGALRGGADAFLLREKEMGGGLLCRMASKAREITACEGALFLVSDRIDVALATGADGVQLPENSFTPEEARRLLGPGRLIGRSVHDPTGAIEAEEGGADFVVVGPVYPTPGKERFALGPDEAAEIVKGLSIPAAAVGGIDAAKAPEVGGVGFRAAAVIRAVAGGTDPEKAARDIRSALEASWP